MLGVGEERCIGGCACRTRETGGTIIKLSILEVQRAVTYVDDYGQFLRCLIAFRPRYTLRVGKRAEVAPQSVSEPEIAKGDVRQAEIRRQPTVVYALLEHLLELIDQEPIPPFVHNLPHTSTR